MLRRSVHFFCTKNQNNKRILSSSFPSVNSHFSSPSWASSRLQQLDDESISSSSSNQRHRFHEQPQQQQQQHDYDSSPLSPSLRILKDADNKTNNISNRKKPVDVAFEDETEKARNAQHQHQPYDNSEENVSRFGDVLHERMRELKAEKHRDFKITTHISPRLHHHHHHQQRAADSDDKENDENFFSMFDDVESELQSGASSSMSQLAMTNNFHNKKSGEADDSQQPQHQPDNSVMLARAIARAGVCSRRAAINLAASGKVKIDGVVQRNPFEKIHAHNDIHIEGHRGRLRFTAPRIWAFHKPSFVPVSSNPVDANYFSNSRTKEQFAMWERYSQMVGVDHLMPVGTMPTRCHGLLMLTNDGELARWLEHRSTRVQSTWIFRVRPPIDPSLSLTLNSNGVRIGEEVRREFQFINFTGGRSRHAIRIKVQTPEPDSTSSSPSSSPSRTTDEKSRKSQEEEDDERNADDDDAKPDSAGHRRRGRNSTSPMPVTQMLEAIDRRVVRGGRVGYGPFTLRGLPPGGLREVAVPPFYMKFINPVWAPFIERDWPYFRRDRVRKLTRMARWRHLNDKEQEEIEAFSCDELRAAFSANGNSNDKFASPIHAEIEQEAQKFAEAIATEPNIRFGSNQDSRHDEQHMDEFSNQQVVDFEDIARKTTNDSKMIRWKF